MEILNKFLNKTPTVGIGELAKFSNIPLNIFQYNLLTGENLPEKNTDYVINGKTYYITEGTALWLLGKANAPYETIREVKKAFDENKKNINEANNNSEDILRFMSIVKQNVSDSMENLNNILDFIKAYESKKPVPVKPQKTKTQEEEKIPESKLDQLLPKRTPEEMDWTTNVCKVLKEKSIKYNRHSNNILNDIYKIMTKNYGICFPQEKLDLKEKYHVDEDVSIPTLRTITYDKKLRSIFEALLLDYDIENYISK